MYKLISLLSFALLLSACGENSSSVEVADHPNTLENTDTATMEVAFFESVKSKSRYKALEAFTIEEGKLSQMGLKPLEKEYCDKYLSGKKNGYYYAFLDTPNGIACRLILAEEDSGADFDETGSGPSSILWFIDLDKDQNIIAKEEIALAESDALSSRKGSLTTIDLENGFLSYRKTHYGGEAISTNFITYNISEQIKVEDQKELVDFGQGPKWDIKGEITWNGKKYVSRIEAWRKLEWGDPDTEPYQNLDVSFEGNGGEGNPAEVNVQDFNLDGYPDFDVYSGICYGDSRSIYIFNPLLGKFEFCTELCSPSYETKEGIGYVTEEHVIENETSYTSYKFADKGLKLTAAKGN